VARGDGGLAELKAAVAHPLLGTVRRLLRQKSPQMRIHRESETYLPLVLSPRARSLREIDGSDVDTLKAVRDAGLRPTHLHDVRLMKQTCRLLGDPGFKDVEWLELSVRRTRFHLTLDLLGREPFFNQGRRRVALYFPPSPSPTPTCTSSPAGTPFASASSRCGNRRSPAVSGARR
jgi:hypothetical protein